MATVEQLGKYEVKRQLGKGAMGTVYEGWDPIIQRRVAIKTVNLPDSMDEETEEALARFKREAQAAGRTGVFRDYRLRVAAVLRDYGKDERAQAPADSRERHGQ